MKNNILFTVLVAACLFTACKSNDNWSVKGCAENAPLWLFQTAYHGICFLYKTGVVVVYGYHLVVFLRQAAHFVEIDLSALGIKINAKTDHAVMKAWDGG